MWWKTDVLISFPFCFLQYKREYLEISNFPQIFFLCIWKLWQVFLVLLSKVHFMYNLQNYFSCQIIYVTLPSHICHHALHDIIQYVMASIDRLHLVDEYINGLIDYPNLPVKYARYYLFGIQSFTSWNLPPIAIL